MTSEYIKQGVYWSLIVSMGVFLYVMMQCNAINAKASRGYMPAIRSTAEIIDPK